MDGFLCLPTISTGNTGTFPAFTLNAPPMSILCFPFCYVSTCFPPCHSSLVPQTSVLHLQQCFLLLFPEGLSRSLVASSAISWSEEHFHSHAHTHTHQHTRLEHLALVSRCATSTLETTEPGNGSPFQRADPLARLGPPVERLE